MLAFLMGDGQKLAAANGARCSREEVRAFRSIVGIREGSRANRRSPTARSTTSHRHCTIGTRVVVFLSSRSFQKAGLPSIADPKTQHLRTHRTHCR